MPRPLMFCTLLAALLPTLVSCGKKDPGYEHLYTTRAIIKSMPGERVTDEFMVHHETIPDYVSLNGSIGMNEMVMPIPVPDKSVLEGFAVGDKVELTFGERFVERENGRRTSVMGVVSVVKLPAGAVLDLNQVEAR